MPTVRAVVLEKAGQRITVLTEHGQFRTFFHPRDVEIGEMVVKWQWGTIITYVLLGLLLFALASFMFDLLLTAM